MLFACIPGRRLGEDSYRNTQEADAARAAEPLQAACLPAPASPAPPSDRWVWDSRMLAAADAGKQSPDCCATDQLMPLRNGRS